MGTLAQGALTIAGFVRIPMSSQWASRILMNPVTQEHMTPICTKYSSSSIMKEAGKPRRGAQNSVRLNRESGRDRTADPFAMLPFVMLPEST